VIFFLFNSVFIKKKTKLIFFFKIKTEPKLVQIDRFRFGLVFRTKTGLNWFDLVFSVWLGFGSVFSRFEFSFFGFRLIKQIEPVSFFKILIGFFHGSVFSIFF